eukprot:358274-Chlamydomonas_euryale.AAC.1
MLVCECGEGDQRDAARCCPRVCRRASFADAASIGMMRLCPASVERGGARTQSLCARCSASRHASPNRQQPNFLIPPTH